MNQNPQNQSFGPEHAAFACEGPATEADLLHQELAGQKAQNLRLASEFELFTQRSRHENTVRTASQMDALLRELLPVLDQLDRALAAGAIPGEPQFRQGVELAGRQLLQLMRQYGVVAEDCAGQPFDPSQHEAVARWCDPGHANRIILKVCQTGYRRGGKAFRPAKVVVNDLAHAQEKP